MALRCFDTTDLNRTDSDANSIIDIRRRYQRTTLATGSIGTLNSTAAIDAGAGPSSNNAFVYDNWLRYMYLQTEHGNLPQQFFPYAAGYDTFLFGSWVYISSYPPSTTRQMGRIFTGAPALYFNLTSAGRMQVRLGSNVTSSTLVAESANGDIPSGSWFWLEIKCLLSTSATGTLEVRVGTTTILSASGVVTSLVNPPWLSFVFGSGVSNSDSTPVRYRDWYLADACYGGVTDFIGPQSSVTKLASSGNGSQTEWDPTSGSDHGALVSSLPGPDPANWVESNDIGAVDTFNFPALGVTPSGTIKGVQQRIYATVTTEYLRAITACVRIGGVTYVHDVAITGYGPPTCDDISSALGRPRWRWYTFVWETNPATGLAWTVSDIDGAEFGCKVA